MKIPFRVSITGILARFFQPNFTKKELKTHYEFAVNEFISNFEKAKKASDEGDFETVKSFFNLYC